MDNSGPLYAVKYFWIILDHYAINQVSAAGENFSSSFFVTGPLYAVNIFERSELRRPQYALFSLGPLYAFFYRDRNMQYF